MIDRRTLAAGLAATGFFSGGLAAPALRAAPWTLANSDVQRFVGADGHSYQLLLSWPEGAPPAGGWPALWVLDGASHFALATASARRLSGRMGAPGLVIGVDSGATDRRIFDYTPLVPGYRIPAGMPANGRALGGADAFLTLLRERVRPRVAARWPIDPRRETLAGHSFGALLALYDLGHFGHFQRYAAISPSLWYGGADNPALHPARADLAGKALLMIRGDEEGGGASAQRPGMAAADLDARGVALAAELRRRGVAVDSYTLSHQGHGGTMAASMFAIARLAFGPGA